MNCQEKGMLNKAFKKDSLDHIIKAPSVSIYGVLTYVSPVKKGRNQNYSEGKFSDGSTKRQVVGFNNDFQKRLSNMLSRKKACRDQKMQN